MGFHVFKTPPLLCRHPFPYSGRDDDIERLRTLLEDILIQTGHHPNLLNEHGNELHKFRILFAPDNKIAKSFITLYQQNAMFQSFLLEFPLLHLRKSKILNMLSAYKDAGLVKFMLDSEETDISKLIGFPNIEKATKNVRRITFSLQIAIIISFVRYASCSESECVVQELIAGDIFKHKAKFEAHLKMGRETNSSFALHLDIINHCEEILAISLAERIGGEEGYDLLLASVKDSLPFSFLNGASSYASFCLHLLIYHYSASPFHQAMKKTLYTTSHGNSTVNFALDTQREMDHQAALKGFRKGSQEA